MPTQPPTSELHLRGTMQLFRQARTKETESTLLAQCLKGNRKAQERVFDRYSPLLMSICLRYTGNTADANEVLVLAFTTIFKKLPSFRGEGSWEGWMRRITVNTCLGYLRKQRRHLYEEIDTLESNDLATLPATTLEADELHALVQALPNGYRTVFNLYAIEGYSHKEIAEQLGITEATSKSQLSRARATLQQQILAQNYHEKI
ncbi:MAG: RNA polymerase sigma factor [Bernardetiaceae bacterium]